MFPVCHIYIASKVMDNISDFAVLGSIYPDAVVSRDIPRNITHYNSSALFNFFKNREKKITDFAKGSITHCVDMKGLDYYSDESFPDGHDLGYCFEKAKYIEKDVVKYCNVPEKIGLWKAHNIIEIAFELFIDKKDGSLKHRFKKVIMDEGLIDYVSRRLACFYSKDAGYFVGKFRKFIDYFDYDNVCALNMAKKYSIQLKIKHGIEVEDTSKMASIILKSLDIIKTDADDFIDYVIGSLRRTMPSIDAKTYD
ncbi:MAG: hypothetical protein QME45_11425 [Clostridiales bacterium]|nr:hypothetical protein [Clostridiales bacterium]HBM79669.1 hypothetical protein [Clostridiaceae bacterium]